MVELTYRAQMAAWFALQADAQFVFNPAFSVGPGSHDTAAIIGLRAEVSF
jgi:carbohydrate-selective porin OprB